MAQNPAIREMVVQGNRVAVIPCIAWRPGWVSRPVRVYVDWIGARHALLVEDLKLRVDHLDVVVGANVADGIWRGDTGKGDAVEVGVGRRELRRRD